MYGVEAFIVSIDDSAEYDRMYSLLTREFGKLRAVVRSVRKPKAKLAGHLDIPNYAWVELVPTSKGWQATQSLEIASYPHIRAHHEALKVMLASAHFLNASLVEGHDREMFGMWKEFLDTMEGFAASPSLIVSFPFIGAQFKLKALSLFGFLPDISVCSVCEKPFCTDSISLFHHEIMCSLCAANKRIQGTRMDMKSLDAIRKCLNSGWMSEHEKERECVVFAHHFEQQSAQYMV